MFYKHFLIAYGFSFHFLNSVKVLVANSTSLKLSAVDGFPHTNNQFSNANWVSYSLIKDRKQIWHSFIYLKKIFFTKNPIRSKIY